MPRPRAARESPHPSGSAQVAFGMDYAASPPGSRRSRNAFGSAVVPPPATRPMLQAWDRAVTGRQDITRIDAERLLERSGDARPQSFRDERGRGSRAHSDG